MASRAVLKNSGNKMPWLLNKLSKFTEKRQVLRIFKHRGSPIFFARFCGERKPQATNLTTVKMS